MRRIGAMAAGGAGALLLAAAAGADPEPTLAEPGACAQVERELADEPLRELARGVGGRPGDLFEAPSDRPDLGGLQLPLVASEPRSGGDEGGSTDAEGDSVSTVIGSVTPPPVEAAPPPPEVALPPVDVAPPPPEVALPPPEVALPPVDVAPPPPEVALPPVDLTPPIDPVETLGNAL